MTKPRGLPTAGLEMTQTQNILTQNDKTKKFTHCRFGNDPNTEHTDTE
jgi:hypothetical protein